MNTKNTKLFSIVIFVKGRNNFTRRILDYFDKINFNYQIVISDGQNDGYVKKLLNKKKYKKLNINFFQYDTNKGFEKYYLMKKKTLNKIRSKYVMMCDNDDFPILKGINHLIFFLEKNQNYVSASGKIMNFEINNFSTDHKGEMSFIKTDKYYRLDEPLKNWKQQLEKTFTNFQSNFYNVYRTNILKKIISESCILNFSDLTIHEFYIQLRVNLLGKSKVLNTVHYLRQRGTSQISNNFDFSKDLLKKNLPFDVRKISHIYSKLLAKKENIKYELINKIFHESFAKYLRHLLAHTVLRYRFKKLYKFKLLLKFFYQKKLFLFYDFYKKFKNFLILYETLVSCNFKNDIREEISYIVKYVRNNG